MNGVLTEFRPSRLEPAWCPGCGNFGIREAVLKALNNKGLPPQKVLFVSGIGQAAKAPHYLTAGFFNGLHGRALPTATGIKLANPALEVIVQSGDGCLYGEGGNHFLAALRRNISLTVLVHNNQVYGLTKGQASPTSERPMVTKAQPFGVMEHQFNPLAVALVAGAGFVARGFSGRIDELAELIAAAIDYPGLALVDILMPCVSFNALNTFAWYKQRVRPLGPDYDRTDLKPALDASLRWGDEIPVGILYQRPPSPDDPPLEKKWPGLSSGPLPEAVPPLEALTGIMTRHTIGPAEPPAPAEG